MKFTKPALTFEQQADLLLGRGLVADRLVLVERLRAVSYYRLSAYWHPYRLPDESLRPGTTLDTIWGRYVFDRRIRLLVIDAIERIEVAIRTRIANALTLVHGPFAHADPTHLPGLSPERHVELMRRLGDDVRNSREAFVAHFQNKYSTEPDLPLWMAVEIMTFGSILTLYRGLPRSLKQQLAGEFGVADLVFESWLLAINQVRNICAHHGRLWNRELGVRPMIPRAHKHPDWHVPVAITGDRLFGMVTVLRYLLRHVAPQSQWPRRFADLLASHPTIPLSAMGFPTNWRQSPLWQLQLAS